MNVLLRLSRLSLWIILLVVVTVSTASATKDSIQAIKSPGGGPYQCCLAFNVINRQDSTRIDEFRVRLISGHGSFISGQSASPNDWTIFQQALEAHWNAITDVAEIDTNETETGFQICVRDTGVFRVVWETRYLTQVVSSDTLSFVCLGTGCDEAFFRNLPSDWSCVYDLDLAIGNRAGKLINDFHLRMLTPSVKFVTTAMNVPSGWTRNYADSALLNYFSSGGMRGGEWREGFRIGATPTVDSFRVAWWTTNFGDMVCTDTVTLRWSMPAVDSLRIVRTVATEDSCCRDFTLRNSHLPSTPLEGFAMKISTAKAKFAFAPPAPAGWTRLFVSASGDSAYFSRSAGLASGDSSRFNSFCFDNAASSTDTVRYEWATYYSGVGVTHGAGSMICQRPLTRRDSVSARVDSSFSPSKRCVGLTLWNRNSRNAVIQSFVIHISNPGKQHSVVSAQAPSGWTVVSVGGDSASFRGGSLAAGSTLTGFSICVNTGDTAMHDPMRIAWATSNTLGVISKDTLSVNVNLVVECDRASGSETSGPDGECCFKLKFYNRNTQGKRLDGFQISVATPSAIFNSASAESPWTVSTQAFPSATVGFGDGVLANGDSIEFNVCLLVQPTTRPFVIPVVWRSYSSGGVVCTDTLRLVCGDDGSVCDTIRTLSSDNSGGVCSYGFRVVNRRSSTAPIDEVMFRIVSGKGRFIGGVGLGDATQWSTAVVTPDSMSFRGGSIASMDSLETFIVRFDSTDASPLVLEACTRNGGVALCCTELTLECATSDVQLVLGAEGFRLKGGAPNPFTESSSVEFELSSPMAVTMTVYDAGGAVVHRATTSVLAAGAHAFRVDGLALPSGVYHYVIEAKGVHHAGVLVLVK